MKFFWKILIAIFINISIYENLLAVYQEILTKILLLQIDDFYFYPDSPNKKKKFELYEKLTKFNGEKFEPQLLLHVSVENLIKYKKTLEILLPLVEEVADNFEETDEYSILYIKLLEYQKDLESVFSNVEEAIFNKQKSVLNTKTESVAPRTRQYIEYIRRKASPSVREAPVTMVAPQNVEHPNAGAYHMPRDQSVHFNPVSWKKTEADFEKIEKDRRTFPHTITRYGLPLVTPGVVFKQQLPWYKRLFQSTQPEKNITNLHRIVLHEFRHVDQFSKNKLFFPGAACEKDADTVALKTEPNPYLSTQIQQKPAEECSPYYGSYYGNLAKKGYIYCTPEGFAISKNRIEDPRQIYQTLKYQRELSHMPWNPKLREEIILGKLDDAHTVYSKVPHTAFKPPPLPYDQKLKKESKLRNLLRKITNNKYIGSSEQPKKKQNIYSGVAQAMQNIQKQAQEIPATHSSEHPTDFTERYLPQENPFG